MNIHFKGKRVLITGATKGIGAAIATAFEDAGASLLLTGTKQQQINTFNEQNNHQGKAHIRWMQVDFSSLKSTQAFLENIANESRIDVLINNAGTNNICALEHVSSEDFDSLLAINLRAPLLLCKSASASMKRQSYGRIVNIASIWSVVSKPGRAMYTSTKAGLAGMTKAAALELAQYGILVNAVSPGFVNTELTEKSLTTQEREQLSRQVPLGRFANPEEVAKTVLFLASDVNTYITGQNLIIDGGFVCR